MTNHTRAIGNREVRQYSLPLLFTLLMMAVLMALPSMVLAATINLRATTGSVTMPDGVVVTIWGFADCGADPACVANPSATLPGPVLAAVAGQQLDVHIKNDLPVDTSFMVAGQSITPLPLNPADMTAKASYTGVVAANGGTGTFSFGAAGAPALREGTYLYESATDQAKQVQMGLHGALIVRPVGYNATTNRIAYTGGTAYTREQVMVLSEIDPDWHSEVVAGRPYNAAYFNPKYWLINGEAYPDTNEVYANISDVVLLRYLNAGNRDHSLVTQGLSQTEEGNDGYKVAYPHQSHIVNMDPGQTRDVVVIPGAAGLFPMFDRHLDITNAGAFPGGMITMMRVMDSADGFARITNPPSTALAGQNYTYDFLALDAANLNLEHRYTLVVGPLGQLIPSGMTIDQATGRITWPIPVNGITSVTVQVELYDKFGVWVSGKQFTVDLNLAVNQSPVLTVGTFGVGSSTAGTVFNRLVEAQDTDGDNLTFTLVSPPLGMTITPTAGAPVNTRWATISWPAAASDEGTTYSFPVSVHVSDGNGGADLQAFNLSVLTPSVLGGVNGPAITTQTVSFGVLEEHTDGTTTPVQDFMFLVTEDNSHVVDPTTQTCDPTCPSFGMMASATPVVASGQVIAGANNSVALPDGRYFVTALTTPLNLDGTAKTGQNARDGGRHKIDGKAFTVAGGAVSVNIGVVAAPVPVSRLSVKVFEDNHPLNSAWDRFPGSTLEGPPSRNGVPERFRVVIEDNLGGQVTTDIHGNPICSEYDTAAINPDTGLVFDWPGLPVLGTGGVCYTDPVTGFVSIENLARGKYGVFVLPPEGTDWIQTTTIEGDKVIDAWAMEGNMGTWPAETNSFVLHGFARPCAFGTCSTSVLPPNGPGRLSGQILKVEPARPPFKQPDGAVDPVEKPWIALNNLSGTRELSAMVRGDANGNFAITGVQDGTYEVVVWDDQLDYIMAIYNTTVPQLVKNAAGTFDEIRDIHLFDPRFDDGSGTGPLPIPDWWGQLHGTVFFDENENGKQDAGEKGLPGEPVDVFYRDGSPLYNTVTDSAGEYHFRRFFPFGHWMIPAVGYARLGATGATVTSGAGLTKIGQDPVENTTYPGPVLTMGNFIIEGGSQTIDWGKKPYPLNGYTDPETGDVMAIPANNGGISGVTVYATTRNEWDPKKQAQDPWEPGIAGVTLHLHEAVIDSTTGEIVTQVDGAAVQGRLLGTVISDDYTADPPTDCPMGTAYNGTGAPRLVDNGDGTMTDPACTETLRTWNQLRPGLFDGGWQFFENCRDDSLGALPNALLPQGDPGCTPLANGKYIVEVIPPNHYKMVSANDINVLSQGDTFTNNPFPIPAAPLLAASGCVGKEYLVTDADSPYVGQLKNDCNLKVVEMTTGANVGTEFHMFTDVPLPARIKGFVNDNLNLESDIHKTQFGDKGGSAFLPVSVRDFKGREVARAYTDENGFFEAILPSTNTVTIPSPTGMAPNVFDVYANDPGDALNPDSFFNPNYNTLMMTFEFYPGKTNFADMALTPVNGFLAIQPLTCESTTATPPTEVHPRIHGLDTITGVKVNNDAVTIHGLGFGTSGTVTIGGVTVTTSNWNDTQIDLNIGLAPVGPQQLMIHNAVSGQTSRQGITFHVTDVAGYNPTFVDATAHPSLQAAIDIANPGDIVTIPGVLATPTIFYEQIILYKDVTLQGYGPTVSVLNGSILRPQEKLEWANRFATAVASGAEFNANHPIKALYPTLTVMGAAVPTNEAVTIDGITVMGGRTGGGIYIASFADNTEIRNSVIENNMGLYTGGIQLGLPVFSDNFINNTYIHHNRISRNGTLRNAGGLGIYDGVTNVQVDHNMICGNGTTGNGGGVVFNTTGGGNHSIDHNDIQFNWAFVDAGGLFVQGIPAANVAVAPLGSAPVTIASNRFQGNNSTEDGAAMSVSMTGNGAIRVENNTVVNNLAIAQGAIKVQDSLNVTLINNTVAHNMTTSTAGVLLLDPGHHTAGLVVYPNTAAYQLPGAPLHSDPALYNNVFWNNRSFTWVPDPLHPQGGVIAGLGSATDAPVVFDLDLYLTLGNLSKVSNNMFSNQLEERLPLLPGGNNQIGVDPGFANPYDYALRGAIVRSAGEVAIHPLAVPVTVTINEPQMVKGDYHVGLTSPAINAGEHVFGAIAAPTVDRDGDARPFDTCHDVGADEVDTAGAAAANCSAALAAASFNITGTENAALAFNGAGFVTGTTYDWNFGDGSAAVLNDPNPSHTYPNSGEYLAVMTVDGTPSTIAVSIGNTAPTVAINGQPTVLSTVGVLTTLTGVATDPSPADQASLTFSWNWDVAGTGETSQSVSASGFHIYTTTGSYTVSLTATDHPDGASASDTITVVVGTATGGTAAGTGILGDLNADGVVNDLDFSVLLSKLGTAFGDPDYLPAADLTGDGLVNNDDLQAWFNL